MHSSTTTQHSEDSWIVSDYDMTELFDKYKAHWLEEKAKYESLDVHFKELL